MRFPELLIIQSAKFPANPQAPPVPAPPAGCHGNRGCRERAAVAIDGLWRGKPEKDMRSWLRVALAAALLATSGGGASGQNYPERPVRVVIAFPAGGSIDTLGRILAQKLTDAWGQSVVIENRPGAGGNLGAAAAAQAAPDGTTLHLGAQTLGVNVTIAPYQGFDPVRDFEPIILVGTAQDVLMV